MVPEEEVYLLRTNFPHNNDIFDTALLREQKAGLPRPPTGALDSSARKGVPNRQSRQPANYCMKPCGDREEKVFFPSEELPR